jgi:hypothetical protein
MKEEHDIDQFFRERLQQDYPYDPKLWSAIEDQLPGATEKKRFWFFNLNSFFLAGVLFICALIPTDTTKTSGVVLGQEAQISSLSTLKKQANLYQTGSRVSHQIDSALTKNSQALNKIAVVENKPTKGVGPIVSAEATNMETIPLKQLSTSNKNENNIPVVSYSNTSFERIHPNTKENSFLSPNDINTPKREYHLPQEISQLSSLPYSLNNSYEIPELKRKEEEIKIRSKAKKPIHYYELVASTSFSVDKEIASGETLFEEYKKEHEKSIRQNTYGINLVNNYRFITYGIGLHKSVYRERASYPVTVQKEGYEVVFDTSYQLVNGNYTSNGHPVWLIEQVISERQRSIMVEGEEIISTHNVIKRLHLPVFVGVQQKFGSFSTELRTAFTANYTYEYSGISINSELNSVQNLESKELADWSFSNNTSFSLGYRLNEFIAVGGRVSYFYDISSFTNDYESRLRAKNIGIWLMWSPK